MIILARSLPETEAPVKKASGCAMDDRPSSALTARTLTFAILSGLPDYHPGKLRVEEIQASGSARILHHGFFDLYRPEVGMSDLGLLIARSIYDDMNTKGQEKVR